MEKKDIEELRERVPCAAVLEEAGWAIDVKESTRRAVKYRRGDDIVIIIHEGKGWFDPLSEAKGDVYSLVRHLDHVGFADALEHVRALIGFVPTEPVWQREHKAAEPEVSIPERWCARRKPWSTSRSWRYLTGERALPAVVLFAARRLDLLREGPHGSMWARHENAAGAVIGWEERGPEWRGFATGGAKELFRFGAADALRACVTEAAIDAMSLAAIEKMRADTLYLSTGGGWSPATAVAIGRLAVRPGTMLVAATDNNTQGEVYAERLEAIAAEAACGFERPRPLAEDWNEELRMMEKRESEREGGGKTRLPHARRPRQG